MYIFRVKNLKECFIKLFFIVYSFTACTSTDYDRKTAKNNFLVDKVPSLAVYILTLIAKLNFFRLEY